MKIFKKIMILLGIGIFLTFVSGCEKEGPMEKAGKKIDESVEKAGDTIDDTMEKAGDKIEEGGEKIQEAAEDASK
jgi:hypothetical protein